MVRKSRKKVKDLGISDIEKVFVEQDKKFDFRNDEIRNYRDKVRELYKKSDLFKRLNKSLQSENIDIKKITKEKLVDRGRPYGESGTQFGIEFNSRLNKFVLTARNGKGQLEAWKEFEKPDIKKPSEFKKGTKVSKDTKKQVEKQEDFLRKRIKDHGFDYQKVYVEEDTEPKKKGDGRKGIITSYNTFFRFSLIIYRMRKGRKYELIYQISDVSNRSIYVPYQKIIAQLKEDVLQVTGLGLEEWIYISKVKKNIFFEGGLRFKRFKNKRFIKSGKFTESIDYDKTINFEDL